MNILSDFQSYKIHHILIIFITAFSLNACHPYGYTNHVDDINKTYPFDCSEDTLAKRLYDLENRAGSLFLEQLYVADSSVKYYANKYDDTDDSVDPANLWFPELHVIDSTFGHDGSYSARIKITANGKGSNLILEKFDYGGGPKLENDREILMESFKKNIVSKLKCP